MMSLKQLKKLLDQNNVKYKKGDYAGNESIIVKGKSYKVEIYEDDHSLVSDFQRIPYLYGRMGSTDIEQIIKDIFEITRIKIVLSEQLELELEENK